MKHQGGCHCKQVSFKTVVDPMLVVQCYCKSCRRLTGSIKKVNINSERKLALGRIIQFLEILKKQRYGKMG